MLGCIQEIPCLSIHVNDDVSGKDESGAGTGTRDRVGQSLAMGRGNPRDMGGNRGEYGRGQRHGQTCPGTAGRGGGGGAP